jgi:hypothetical protein
MYLGPLRWPTWRIVAGALVVGIVVAILVELTGSPVPFVVAVVVILVIAARARVADFRSQGGLGSPPDDDGERRP